MSLPVPKEIRETLAAACRVEADTLLKAADAILAERYGEYEQLREEARMTAETGALDAIRIALTEVMKKVKV